MLNIAKKYCYVLLRIAPCRTRPFRSIPPPPHTPSPPHTQLFQLLRSYTHTHRLTTHYLASHTQQTKKKGGERGFEKLSARRRRQTCLFEFSDNSFLALFVQTFFREKKEDFQRDLSFPSFFPLPKKKGSV